MRRFFVPAEVMAGSEARITGDTFRHMAKVLRLKQESEVLLSDGHGRERIGIVRRVERESIVLDLLEAPPSADALPVPVITLYQGLPKGDKIDLVLQKATELGAATVIPFLAERSVKRIDPGREADLVARWQRIVREAARQCGRSSFPRIGFTKSLREAVQDENSSVKLLLWEEQGILQLKEALAKLSFPERIAVIIGPEGGISTEEAAVATECGFIPVSMGKRIVRTETAGIVILSILQFVWGDIG